MKSGHVGPAATSSRTIEFLDVTTESDCINVMNALLRNDMSADAFLAKDTFSFRRITCRGKHQLAIHLQAVWMTEMAAGVRGGPVVEPLCSLLKRAVNKKVLPIPTVLSTQMRPPISPTRRDEMASPNPVPPCFREMDPSAWRNASNMISCLSAGMPGPVS